MKRNFRVLLAMDGSDQSVEAVRYAGGIFPSKRTEFALYHVRTDVPEAFLDMGRNIDIRYGKAPADAWMKWHAERISGCMGKAHAILKDAGFSDEALTIMIRPKNRGIARDILDETKNGYDILIAGRNGFLGEGKPFLGSVAHKLISGKPPIPIAIVGGKPETKNVLAGFDGSDGAMKAAYRIGEFMGESRCHLTFCHVIRPLGIHAGIENLYDHEQETEWSEMNAADIGKSFLQAKRVVLEEGFTDDRVSSKIVAGKASRASALLEIASRDDYGTIVLGRRGLTMVDEFYIGRVSEKVLRMADKMAVWIM